MISTANASVAAKAGAKSDVSLVSILALAFVGMVLLYGAGFAQPQALHNATHDTRHATGFPCH